MTRRIFFGVLGKKWFIFFGMFGVIGHRMNRYPLTIPHCCFAAMLVLQLPGRVLAQAASTPAVALTQPEAGPVAPGLSEPQMLEAWGWITAQEKDVADAELSACRTGGVCARNDGGLPRARSPVAI